MIIKRWLNTDIRCSDSVQCSRLGLSARSPTSRVANNVATFARHLKHARFSCMEQHIWSPFIFRYSIVHSIIYCYHKEIGQHFCATWHSLRSVYILAMKLLDSLISYCDVKNTTIMSFMLSTLLFLVLFSYADTVRCLRMLTLRLASCVTDAMTTWLVSVTR